MKEGADLAHSDLQELHKSALWLLGVISDNEATATEILGSTSKAFVQFLFTCGTNETADASFFLLLQLSSCASH